MCLLNSITALKFNDIFFCVDMWLLTVCQRVTVHSINIAKLTSGQVLKLEQAHAVI